MGELIESIELQALTLTACNFEMPDPKDAAGGGSIHYSGDGEFAECETDERFELIASFSIRGFRGEKELFMLRQAIVASFLIVDSAVFESVSDDVQLQYCVSLVYPSIRENAERIFSKAGLRQINIPLHFNLIDVK